MPTVKTSTLDRVVTDKGEIIYNHEKSTLSWGAEPRYIKLYLDDILYLSDIPSRFSAVLFELLKYATYANEGMEIFINASMKKRIMKNLGYQSLSPINNALSQLARGKVLLHPDTGYYVLNPIFFGKGDWQDISKLRGELHVYYDEFRGRTFSGMLKQLSEEKTDDK